MLCRIHDLALLAFVDSFNELASGKIIHIFCQTIVAVDKIAHWIMRNVLDSCVMVISKPTLLDGFLLNHVYINKYILPEVETVQRNQHWFENVKVTCSSIPEKALLTLLSVQRKSDTVIS